MRPLSTIAPLVALGLVVLLLAGCQGEPAPAPVTTFAASVSTSSDPAEMGDLTALGTVRPAQTVQLSFGASGPVDAVMAQLGVEVVEGALLAELDTAALELELQSAQQEAVIRQAQLDSLLNGPDAWLLERAEADHAQQVAQAEIALRVAHWRLEQAQLQSYGPAVAAAQSSLQGLELQLAQSQALSTAPEVAAARVGLTRAQDGLADAQEEYQKAVDRPWEPDDVLDAYARALRHAEQEAQIAEALLHGVLGTQAAHSRGLGALAAQRDVAEAQLAQTLDAQEAYSLTLELLSAEVDLAQLALDGLLAWENPLLDPAPPEQAAQARARLRQAELAVARLELQMQGAELHAPFDGVISAVQLRPGEWCSAGVPAVELVDTTGWLVETRNVGELNIGRVQVGAEAIVHVNAFRGEELRGKVVAIPPIAVVQQGDTTYTLTIELEHTDLNLRPGMNAQVELPLE